ncbi:hypothetical protein B0A50_01344 [Salinomyces thailandicus]|uniref:RecQ-mediated genome instability protein 1 n=1 Tax=Salinomyces thailandicus TaxID=706561 RepID=A0A4U0UAC5_9PEZI|nr:hypothetical protein B0A50_01344 [Salinomyces thailandica]
MAGVNDNVPDITASISAFLTAKGVTPTQAWLQSFMPTVRLNTPIAALQKTALFRLLVTDLTTSIVKSPTSCFPPNMTEPQVKDGQVRGPVTAQVLDVEDISRSCWSQVEAIEAQERGETTKGREIIRVVPDENNLDSSTQAEQKPSGVHKLLLQDANGAKAYAIELAPVNGVGMQMAIGVKLVLRDFNVARGVVLLEPRSTEVLGGKVDVWEKKWREDRKAVLTQKAGVRDEAP